MVTIMLDSPVPYTAATSATPRVARNESAWSALLARHDDAYLLALRLTGNAADAEDVVQEAYVRALKVARQIPAGFDGWFWFQRVLINAARDYRTSEQRRTVREQAAAAQQPPAERSNPRDESELRDAVADALLSLEADVRTILCLHYEQNLPYFRAAELLGANEGTLRATASRGIQALRDKLARSGYHVAPAVLVGTLNRGLGIQAPAGVLVKLLALKSSAAAAKLGATKFTALVVLKALFAVTLLAGMVALVRQAPELRVQRAVPGAGVAPVTRGDERPAPAIAQAQVPPGESISPALAAILARKVTVSYRRDFLYEVLDDLKQRTGLRAAYPEPLRSTFLFTADAQDVTVESVLRQLAHVGDLKLEFHGDTVVFWNEAEWLDLVSLHFKAATGTREDKRDTLHAIALRADKHIYPTLFTLATDSDPLISAEALANLSVHHFRTLRYGAGTGDLVTGLLKRLDAGSAASNRPLVNVLSATGDPRVAPEFLKLLKSGTPPVRANITYALEILSGEDLDKVIVPLLSDPQTSVRGPACVVLGWSGGARYFEAVRKLLQDSDPVVRSTAASTLAQLAADPTVRAWLLEQLKAPPPDLELPLATAFNAIREPAAIPDLLKLLQRDDPQLQQMVALALGYSRDARAIEPLFGLLTGPDQSVAQQAAWALGLIRDDTSIPRLKTLLTNANPQVRANAAVALSTFRSPDVVESLLALQKDQSPVVRARLAVALLQVFDGRTVSVLQELLRDPDPNVRAETAMEIGRGGDSASQLTDSIVGLVADADAHVRASAIIGLAQSMTPAAVDAVIKALDDPDDTVRRIAYSVLSQCHAYRPDMDKILEKARAAHAKPAPKPPAPPSEF